MHSTAGKDGAHQRAGGHAFALGLSNPCAALAPLSLLLLRVLLCRRQRPLEGWRVAAAAGTNASDGRSWRQS